VIGSRRLLALLSALSLTALSMWTVAPQAAAQTAATPVAAVQYDYDALFQQMFRDPSNLEISFKFAEQAAARGDYEAAIGALERMLFFNPNLPRVKLELGVLYFKLGSYDLARSYLQDAIKGGGVPDDIRAQVNAYLAEIVRRQSPYEFSGFAQFGGRWQSNANIGPDSLLVRAIGQDAILSNQFARAPDWNLFELAALQYIHKLNKRGDTFEMTLTGYASQQQKFKQFDLGLVEVMVGPRIALTHDTSVKLYGIGNYVALGGARYFESLGGGVSLRTPLAGFGLAEAYVERRHRSFYDSVNFPTASEQTGNLLTAALNTDLRFGFVRWTTRLAFDRNEAKGLFDYNSYRRYSADIGLPFEFSVPFAGTQRQVIITPTAGFSDTRYDMPNFIVDPFVTRHDREVRVGGIFDVQLYQNFGLRTQVMQTWIDSNLPNFTMKNLSVAIGPTARF
jgi:hypothetical protein